MQTKLTKIKKINLPFSNRAYKLAIKIQYELPKNLIIIRLFLSEFFY